MNSCFMALKNLKKNFSFYSLYFISITFVITVFSAFASFSANRIILEKISSDGRVETMCDTVSVFLMAFVIFYMTYSNRFFLRRRAKELGIYAVLGYRKSEVLSLLTFENLLLFGMAFLLGILFGGLAHKGIVFLIVTLLQLGIDHSEIPLLYRTAIWRTALFLWAVVLFITLSNGRFLFRTPLINLVRFEKRAEKKMKFRRIPAALGFFLILAGYLTALNVLSGSDSAWVSVGFYQMGLLTLFLVAAGTVLFIASFLPYVMEQSKKRRGSFYTPVRIITTPNFIYRIRSNSKTLIMLTLLSGAALTISSVMALSVYYPIASVSRVAPSEIEFPLDPEKTLDEVTRILKRYAPDSEDAGLLRTDLYKVTSDSDHLPAEYSLGSSINEGENEKLLREAGFECISYSQYAKLLEAQGRTKVLSALPALSENECILLKYQPEQDTEEGRQYRLQYQGGERTVTVKKVSLENAISFANSVGTLVLSDSLCEEIGAVQSPFKIIISINGSSLKNNEELYQALYNYLEGSPYLQGNSHRIHELLYLNSSTFLLIGFLVVLFFLAVGSILYFNNLSSVMDSRADYEILRKIGYRKSQIKRILRKQILTFFAIPFLLGSLDCLFATLVYKTGLMQNLLGSSLTQYLPVLAAWLLTGLIYLMYYALTLRSCCRAAIR